MIEYISRNPQAHLQSGEDWFFALLAARGADTPQKADAFLRPSFDQLSDPFELFGVDAALSLIRECVSRHLRVAIYGDYDADGICASVILKEAFEAVGLRADIHIPDRHTQGYGLHPEIVQRLAEVSDLLVTADCGISNVDEVRMARDLGMRVLVTDHHQPPSILPEADVIVNPLLSDPPGPPLCGAGVAWKLAFALKGEEFAKEQLDLAALATIADMVPLTGENRVIASLGLERIAETGRAGLQALMRQAGLPQKRPVSSGQVAFALAPRLNAGGRLADAMDAVELLGRPDENAARRLALKLDRLNDDRRLEEARVLSEARRQLEEAELLYARTVVLVGSGWNSGVVGLVAGRIAEEIGYPTVVLTAREGHYTGSARTAGDVDLFAALSGCSSLLARFGGHRQAAGLTLPATALAAFASRFDQAVKDQLMGRDLVPRAYYDLTLPLSEATPETARRLEALAPFGVGNPSPVFLAKNVALDSPRAVGENGKHLKMRLRWHDLDHEAIYFGAGSRLETLPPEADILYRPTVSEYRGRVSVQCQLQAMAPAEKAFRQDRLGEWETILQDLARIPSNRVEGPPLSTEMSEGGKKGTRGMLLFCRTWETAMAMRLKHRDFGTAVGGSSDRRCYSTVLYRSSLLRVTVPFTELVFCDGLLHPEEAVLARELFPDARLVALPKTAALAQRLEEMSLSRDELREAYRFLRDGGQAPVNCLADRGKALAALAILTELSLIVGGASHPYAIKLLPMKKRDPESSRLYRRLRCGGQARM